MNKLKLYKFDRTEGAAPEDNGLVQEGRELVPFLGDAGINQEDNPPEPPTLEEARRQVAEALAEIWQLPESERRSAVRRLIRQWHPDRNQHREQLATQVTQFLLNEVERLENGGIPGYQPDVDNANQQPPRPGEPNRDGFNFREYFRRHGERARRRREHRGGFEPANRNEAERWMKQAEEDLKTATYLFGSMEETFYSFTCFHSQQAIEKALKGFVVANGRLLRSDLEGHELLTLAYRASQIDPRLHGISGMVRVIHGQKYYVKTRYPDYLSGGPIPAEKFTERSAEEALSNARNILQLLREVMD